MVSLDTRVEHIDWSEESRVIVTTDSGRSSCEHVIVTLPLGVLQRHHSTLFTPGLGEEKMTAIMRMGAGRISKMFLEWGAPWWLPDHVNLNLGTINWSSIY